MHTGFPSRREHPLSVTATSPQNRVSSHTAPLRDGCLAIACCALLHLREPGVESHAPPAGHLRLRGNVSRSGGGSVVTPLYLRVKRAAQTRARARGPLGIP